MKLNYFLAATFAVSLLQPLPAHAGSNSWVEQCDAAVGSVIETLSKTGATVSADDRPIETPFKYIDKEILFVIKGKSADDIMASLKLQKYIAVKVINACQPVARVSFGLANSDWINSFSYRGEGIGVIKDTCIEPGSAPKAKWGEEYCL